MAKRSFSPVLWFLLAVVLRADMTASGQTNYRMPASSAKTSAKTLRWQPPQKNAASQALVGRGQLPVPDAAVEYEISGEPYREDPFADESATRKRTSKPASSRRNSKLTPFDDEEYEPPRQPVPEVEQVSYAEEEYVESGVHPDSDGLESDYVDEMYEEEYWGEEGDLEGADSESTRPWHWFGNLKPKHGHWFRTSKNSPPHLGVGEPLKGTSWLNRPSGISFFVGILNGQELITDHVDQGSALFGGLRLGWDFDHYWGVEARAGWSSPMLFYEGQTNPDRTDGIFLCDVSFLYYPLGDSAWRPYGLLGMGMARFDFVDDIEVIHDEYLLGIPVGFGLKYQYHPNLVFRGEVLDNIACGSSGINNMNNLSFTFGMELRFGGKPPSYYPWQPAKFIW